MFGSYALEDGAPMSGGELKGILKRKFDYEEKEIAAASLQIEN